MACILHLGNTGFMEDGGHATIKNASCPAIVAKVRLTPSYASFFRFMLLNSGCFILRMLRNYKSHIPVFHIIFSLLSNYIKVCFTLVAEM